MTLPSSRLHGAIDMVYTVKEAGLICSRAPKTIRNLIYKHQIPVRYGREPWRGRGKYRRIILLSADQVRRLRHLTMGV